MRRYKKIMLCGGIILFCLSEGIGLSWGQESEGATQSSFWDNSTTLALLAWAGTIASGIGLIASVCAAVKAKNSEKAAIAARNSTLNIVHNFKDAKLSGKIKALIERIKHIETLIENENKSLLLYIIDEMSLDLSEIKSEISISDEEILSNLMEVRGIFQDSRESIQRGNLTSDDLRRLSKNLGDAKILLTEISSNIQRIVEENVNE